MLGPGWTVKLVPQVFGYLRITVTYLRPIFSTSTYSIIQNHLLTAIKPPEPPFTPSPPCLYARLKLGED
ncbi:hypothetical protein SBA4_3210005 [Candidatus Sulfopaludibacter sp. SbA4]|nr:hypothetical protein SBA4_3210005 [Candidatus Sulfopaludibacter sp. SbA4]